MLFASIHLGSTTTTTIIISSLINKKKMIRLLPVHNARRAMQASHLVIVWPSPLDSVFAAGLTLRIIIMDNEGLVK